MKYRANPRSPAPVRFWCRVNKNGPLVSRLRSRCWVWIGYYTHHGYGSMVVDKKPIGSHRYSWIIHNGDPGKLFVLHKCDNPLCVNPKHLFLGTDKDNKDDCVRKDRHARGERNRHAKLTQDEVRFIRKRYGYRGRGGLSAYKLAKMLSVTHVTVYRIVHGVRWKHL